MQVPFGEWLPDQPDHLKKGANVATNVYYAQNSYKRFPSLVDYSSNTCATDSKGAGSFRDNSNTVYNFIFRSIFNRSSVKSSSYSNINIFYIKI